MRENNGIVLQSLKNTYDAWLVFKVSLAEKVSLTSGRVFAAESSRYVCRRVVQLLRYWKNMAYGTKYFSAVIETSYTNRFNNSSFSMYFIKFDLSLNKKTTKMYKVYTIIK